MRVLSIKRTIPALTNPFNYSKIKVVNARGYFCSIEYSSVEETNQRRLFCLEDRGRGIKKHVLASALHRLRPKLVLHMQRVRLGHGWDKIFDNFLNKNITLGERIIKHS